VTSLIGMRGSVTWFEIPFEKSSQKLNSSVISLIALVKSSLSPGRFLNGCQMLTSSLNCHITVFLRSEMNPLTTRYIVQVT